MPLTRIEIGPDTALRCVDCDRRDLREATLVDEYGIVLLRGTACPHCRRHRIEDEAADFAPTDPFETGFHTEYDRRFDDTGSNRFAFRS